MAELETPATNEFQRLFSMAVEKFEAGDIIAAKVTLEDLLAKVPDHPQILNYLAVTTHLAGDTVRAQALLRRAVKVEPSFVDAWNNLGLLSLEHGSPKTAVNAFVQICRLAPEAPEPAINLAHAMHAEGLYDEAIEAYKKGLSMNPNHPSAWGTFCRALLVEGHWENAKAAADRQLIIRPGHTVALALKSVALQELRDDKALRELVNFDDLIGCYEIEVPAGYTDLNNFNSVLSNFCKNHSSLAYAPKDKSTELGFQTKNLVKEADSPIADLIRAIEKCAELYRTERPISPGHPFLGQRPNSWYYDIWATVLESGGHQDNHIHRDGWLSGVYYAQTPELIVSKNRGYDTAGWIEFGSPVVYPKAQAIPVTRCYPPTEGSLYLFPSYFYHRTLPFFSGTQRVSIAFDLRDRPIIRQARYIDYVDG